MKNNFWQTLERPIFALAPMEDVTDAAFRRLIASYAAPQVQKIFFTEFTSADGLLLADERGKRKLLKKLLFDASEHPVVAQLFTAVPAHMAAAAKLVAELGFDGVDINMGCPDRSIEKSRCGAALIKDPSLARELIAAAKESGLPVSVKTRLGYAKDQLDTWLPELLAEEPVAVTLHARTRNEMSKVPARWERVKRGVAVRTEMRSPTLIIGNGDVRDLDEAREKTRETGCDGVMLGRAVFGNPWLFAEREEPPSAGERTAALQKHLRLFEELLGGTTHYAVMKKHFKAYLTGWDGAKELRGRLMDTGSVEQALVLLQEAGSELSRF